MWKILMLLMLVPSVCFAQFDGPTVSGTGDVTQAGPRYFYEQGTAPSCFPETGVLYTKDVAGVTSLYYRDAACVETLVVPGGGPGPGSAVWCGKTAATYDGNDAGSYAAANALCATVGTCTIGHVCRLDEMIDLVNQGSAFTGHGGSILWANAGGPGYTAYATDCQGWTETSHTSPTAYTYGNTWDFSGAQPLPFVGYCTSSYAYACCQ